MIHDLQKELIECGSVDACFQRANEVLSLLYLRLHFYVFLRSVDATAGRAMITLFSREMSDRRTNAISLCTIKHDGDFLTFLPYHSSALEYILTETEFWIAENLTHTTVCNDIEMREDHKVDHALLGRVLGATKERLGDLAGVRAGDQYSLTRREQQCLALVGQGLTSKQSGDKLGISSQAVNFHILNVCSKLKARNRTHAVALAMRNHLI